jgi:hypothetical protein
VVHARLGKAGVLPSDKEDRIDYLGPLIASGASPSAAAGESQPHSSKGVRSR